MDLGKYVKDYESAQEQKRAEAEQEQERQRIARSVNAKAAENCLREIVGPVLARARDQLKEAKCTVELIWKSKDDDTFKASPVITYEIEIILRAGPPGSAPIQCSKLAYYGSFMDQEIRHAVEISTETKSQDERIPIEIITQPLIEQHIDKFAKAVFNVRN